MKKIKKTLGTIIFFLLSWNVMNCNALPGTSNKDTGPDTNLLLAMAVLSTGSPVQVTTLDLSESGISNSKEILNQPEDITIGQDGLIYVADSKNNRIVKITSEGVVTSIASSSGNGSTVTVINNPEGITAGPNGILYVANSGASSKTNSAYDGHNILSINTSSGNTISLLSGKDRPTSRETIDGDQGTNRFYKPEGIRYANNKLVVAENGGFSIREVNTTSGSVTTLTGEKTTGDSTPTPGTPYNTDGPATSARFNSPKGVVADSKGNVYIADGKNHCIRKYDPSTGQVSTFAGSKLGFSDSNASGFVDGQGTSAKFNSLYMITIDEKDNLYVADAGNYAIRKISASGYVSTLAGGPSLNGRGDGSGSTAQFYNPKGIYYYKNTLYITDVAKNKISGNTSLSTDYSAVRKISNVF
ncbi:MAG: hypothetical protein H7A24_10570 [Leptospiraceae bacterium]|nr:hypothetical protein [Leptospiraceae bacterium]